MAAVKSGARQKVTSTVCEPGLMVGRRSCNQQDGVLVRSHNDVSLDLNLPVAESVFGCGKCGSVEVCKWMRQNVDTCMGRLGAIWSSGGEGGRSASIIAC